MTISLDLVIPAQSDAPVLRRQLTGAFLAITRLLLVKPLMSKGLALHIILAGSDTWVW